MIIQMERQLLHRFLYAIAKTVIRIGQLHHKNGVATAAIR